MDRNRLQSTQHAMQDVDGRLMPRFSSATRFSSSQEGSGIGSREDGNASDQDASSIHTTTSQNSLLPSVPPGEDVDEDETAAQDIEELWFPGCHADLGGGWPLADGEESPLSHAPLVWMVREAQRAGIDFDQSKMRALGCCDSDDGDMFKTGYPSGVPEVQITKPPDLFHSPHSEHSPVGWAPGLQPQARTQSEFHRKLHVAATKGVLHDCLEFKNGLPATSVLSWKIMEYMPFRRMDLTPDGTWKAITWPLPRVSNFGSILSIFRTTRVPFETQC